MKRLLKLRLFKLDIHLCTVGIVFQDRNRGLGIMHCDYCNTSTYDIQYINFDLFVVSMYLHYMTYHNVVISCFTPSASNPHSTVYHNTLPVDPKFYPLAITSIYSEVYTILILDNSIAFCLLQTLKR